MSPGAQRVLVTGADGFIGSHLVERLLDDGHRVRAFCMYNSSGSRGWLDELGRDRLADVDVQLGDIRDSGCVEAAVADMDVVFHLAALIAIPYSYEAPRSFVDTNVIGTVNVLEAAKRSGVTRVVHTSTSEVYGTPKEVPIRLSHELRGQSPYSASKIAADKMCEAYALSFGTPVVILRPFNTFGPRQSARAVIPTILGQLLVGADELRLGSVDPQRDFTYVSDTVDAFVRMADADLERGSVVQIGSGSTISIGDLVELSAKVVGHSAEVVSESARVRPAGSEVQVLLCDPSLAHDALGWRPQVDLEAGLRRTADWLRDRVDPARAAQYQR